MKTTPSPAVEWPPGGAASSTRSASHGKASTDFGALLDTHQARTATAEGPKKEAKLDKDKPVAPAVPEQQEPAPEAKPAQGQKPEASEAQQPQPEGDQPTVETPVIVVEPVVEVPVVLAPAPVTPAPAPEQPVDAPVAPQPELQQQQQLQAQAPVAAAAAVAASVTEQTAEVAAAVAHQPVEAKPQQPQVQAPVVAGEQPADATPEQPVVRADRPAQPQGQQQQPQTQQQPQQQAGDQPRQQPHADQRVADQPRIATQEQPVQQRVATAAEPRADRAQPQPVQANASTTGLTNAAAPTAPQAAANRSDVPVRAVPLSRAADAVENVIRLGSQRGVTHARLSLRPADLGGVEIRLQQTATGLTASVVADGVEAAQALLQAGAELRQKLEAQGIQLQSLDISYSGDEQADARSAAAQTGDGEHSSATGDSSSTATDGGELTPTEEITVKEILELPDGVLVDVLA